MAHLHVATPLEPSEPLSAAASRTVLLKMETRQPTGCFKLRGLGQACQHSVRDGANHLVCSSGGNAGLAVAYAGRELSVHVTVVVPRTTPAFMSEKIGGLGATVLEYGAVWDEAHAHALNLASEAEAAYIHPFDDPRIWAGHATIVDELLEQAGEPPGGVVVSVGGGGLLCGVIEGLHRHGLHHTPVMAVETVGADSLARSVKSGRLVTLDTITSLATSLGARTVAAQALAWALRHPVSPWTVTDRAAVEGCVRFRADHGKLVEPACGASLAAVYKPAPALARGTGPWIVVLCGGAGVSPDLMDRWVAQVGLA